MARRVHGRQIHGQIGVVEFIKGSWLNWLLVFIPLTVTIGITGAPKLWLFLTSALAIVPLAGLIGSTTEQISSRTGPGLGGLLNATFGNATELIIALFALSAGLQEIVKASISGSIIGNNLLVLGASMFAGGLGREKQTFSRTKAGASAAMLFLAVVALVMPAVFDLAVFGTLERSTPRIELLSLLVSMVLIFTYLASLIFAFKTHRDLISSVPSDEQEPRLSISNSIMLLALATAAVAWESEVLVGAVEGATRSLGMTEFFVGVVIVAIVGNAAEHFSAVLMARRNHMELAVTIATGSSTQIALFVAPVLVFASFVIGNPLSLVFNAFEIAAIGLSVMALSLVSLDGESNWFEGMQLIAVYVILAIVFYFVPAG
ncbi:calcium/proton exchanger [bacterium]|nr:calcium/proton exchanger [bacterium]